MASRLGLVLAFCALFCPARMPVAEVRSCKGVICFTPLCHSDPPGLGLSLTTETGIEPNVGQLRIDNPTHFNIRSRGCLDKQKEIGLQHGVIRLPSGCWFSIQVCKRGGGIISHRSRCSDWVEFQVSCPSRESKRAPGVASPCGPARYGTPGCPYPPFGGANAPPEKPDPSGPASSGVDPETGAVSGSILDKVPASKLMDTCPAGMTRGGDGECYPILR